MKKSFNGILRLDYYGYKIYTVEGNIIDLSEELEYIYMLDAGILTVIINSAIKQEFFERGDVYKDKNVLGKYVLHMNNVDLNSCLLKLVGNLILISIEIR